MTVRDKVLEELEKNRGEYISGEQLAEALSVSRAAVWKAIKSLKDKGFMIEGVNNKGYRLKEETDVLSVKGVAGYLNVETPVRVEVYKTVTSTNLLVKDRASEPEGLVIAATEQTNGMGRLGRTFVSPADSGIYFSILLKPDIDNNEVTLLTTIAGVSVCEAIEKYTDKKPMIKWVNDVFIDDRKVCGILTQASFSMENFEPEYVVVGIGINLYHPDGGFNPEVDKVAGNVLSHKEGDIKNKILAEVLNRYFYYYSHFKNKEFIQEYRSRSFVIGRRIKVVAQNSERYAEALDVDDECHLIVRYDDGSEETLSTGEISIRLNV